MKNLIASYNADASKIMELANQKKAMREILNFLIDIATIAMVPKDTKAS